MDKFFNIGIDIKNERIKVLEGIFTGDSVRMRLTLSDNGKRIDFTGAQIIRLTVRKGDYKTVETVELLKEIQAAEAENGIIEIILPESFVSDKGMHQLQAALIGADGQISCARVNYIVSSAGEDTEASEEDLQTCGQLLKKASAALDAENARVTAEAARQTAEDLRAAAEAERKTAENDREAAETERAGNETVRQAAEAEREAAESDRSSAEGARKGMETLRKNAEKARAEAETERAAAEGERTAAETERQEAETARQAAETARANAEAARESAEKSRAAAETNRGYKEIDRGNRELQRKSAETTRTNNETARANAEAARAAAEDDRTAAEAERAAAETARESAETERAAAEAERAEALKLKADYSYVDTELAAKADVTDIPTKVSELENDSGYITELKAFDKLCPTGSAESLTSSLTLADCCGGTNVRNYVIHGAEGGVGDLNSGTGKYEIPVTVRGKNLISISRDIQSLTSGIIVEKGKDYVIARMRASAENAEPGTTNSSSGWIGINTLKATAEAFNKCFFKDIKPGTTYTLSYDFEYFYLPDGLTSVKHRGQISISGKAEYTNAYVTEAGKKYHYKLTFTTPETITQIMFFFTLNSCKVKLSNIMLEEGGSETDYERYAEPQTAVIELSAPLGKNDHVVNASGTTFKNSVLSKASTAEIPLIASGTNIIEVGTATAPGKIEVEYYKDINKIVNNLTNAILAQGGNV